MINLLNLSCKSCAAVQKDIYGNTNTEKRERKKDGHIPTPCVILDVHCLPNLICVGEAVEKAKNVKIRIQCSQSLSILSM